MRSVRRVGRSIDKAVHRELDNARKATANAAKQAREAVEDTGEKLRKSGRTRMVAAGALAAVATGAAVEAARRRQPADRRELTLKGADERGLRGVAHRAFDSLSDFASQIATSVIPGSGESSGRKEGRGNGSASARSNRRAATIAMDPDLPAATASSRRKYMERVNRKVAEEFDRSWEA